MSIAAAPAEAALATWDRNPEPDVRGYVLSYGTESGQHTTSLDVGNVVSYEFFPPSGRRYYVVVQAYNSAGVLGPKSSEVIYDAPATTTESSDGQVPGSQTPPIWSDTGSTISSSDVAVEGDYDGDGRADVGTWRRDTGEWRLRLSANGYATASPIQWGVSTDLPMPADYDGDRRTDLAVYRPSNGIWYILLSSTNFQARWDIQFGTSTDRPQPVDYDHDGRADLVLPRSGGFVILSSSSDYAWGSAVSAALLATDTIVRGDFDGDGRADLSAYRASTGEWLRWLSASNFGMAGPIQWGAPTDVPVPADYDGDRRTDIAVFRPSNGVWYVLLSSMNFQGHMEIRWGSSQDLPLPVDFDGDGRADLALLRSNGFAILRSGTNYSSVSTVP